MLSAMHATAMMTTSVALVSVRPPARSANGSTTIAAAAIMAVERDARPRPHIGGPPPGAPPPAERPGPETPPKPAFRGPGDPEQPQPVFRVDEIADQQLALQRVRNRERQRRRAEDHAQRLLGD